MSVWDWIKSTGEGIAGSFGAIASGVKDVFSQGGQKAADAFSSPARGGDKAFRDPNQANFDLPGFEGRQALMMSFGKKSAVDFLRQGRQLRDFYGALARGEDSISARQLRDAAGRNVNQQMAMAASASPQNAALAARMAAQNAQRTMSGLAGQQALAGIAERQAAAQALQGLRGQDLQSALGFSQLDLQNALGQQRGMMGFENARTQRYLGSVLGPSWGEVALGGLQAGASLAAIAASDRRVKKNIESGAKEADDFLKALKAYKYEYKDQKYGTGKQLSVMAQDLEKSKIGKKAVFTDAEGVKRVNYLELIPALVAGLARVNEKVEKYG